MLTTAAHAPSPTPDADRFANWPGCDPASMKIVVNKNQLPQRGDVIEGRYRIETRLGEGAIPSTFSAHDVDDGTRVVLHLLPLRRSYGPESIERFGQHTRVLRNLDHPCIATIQDFGQTLNGHSYFVSRYYPGEDLQHRLTREGPLPWSVVGPIAVQICGALHAAHRRGLVHGDVKPSNIMVHQGTDDVDLRNFGVAELSRRQRQQLLAPTGSVLGTVEFLSPEAWRDLPLDQRTDIYGLGMTLYLLLSGHLPTDYDPSRARVPGKPYRALADDVPLPVRLLVYRCIATDPADRFPTAEALFEALLATLPANDITARAQRRAVMSKDRDSFAAHARRMLMVVAALGALSWLVGS